LHSCRPRPHLAPTAALAATALGPAATAHAAAHASTSRFRRPRKPLRDRCHPVKYASLDATIAPARATTVASATAALSAATLAATTDHSTQPAATLTAPALAGIPGAQLAIEKVAPSELGMSTWACPCLPCRPCLAICPCN